METNFVSRLLIQSHQDVKNDFSKVNSKRQVLRTRHPNTSKPSLSGSSQQEDCSRIASNTHPLADFIPINEHSPCLISSQFRNPVLQKWTAITHSSDAPVIGQGNDADNPCNTATSSKYGNTTRIRHCI